jgi:hypothetical protein
MSVITDNAQIIFADATYKVGLKELYGMKDNTEFTTNRLATYLMILRVLKWDLVADYFTTDQTKELESKIQAKFGTYNYL